MEEVSRSTLCIIRVGMSTYYKIIAETCKIIATVLTPMYVKLPNTEGWLSITKDFEEKWQFPNCIGALDGKHMRIRKPDHGGSVFFNYKRFHSIVLMAISDAHCRFVWFSVGDGGSFSDASVFSDCSFNEKLSNDELHIPAPTQLPSSDRFSPFVFISDEIFGLEKNLMKPYNRKLLRTEREKIFNYRLSRARFTIECAFGILCSKWQLLNNALRFNLITSKYIISACLCLHNFLITSNRQNQHSNNGGEVRQPEVQNARNNRSIPVLIRHNLAEYFCNEGTVPWQRNYI
ncbi:uncharacterized protein LOC103317169 [Nasonia vitripennis]|uniref:DDE Tnp4 domain-containing protein n=1 Tax=Nasonia vitripennis TaxID=7425 RepID=A0A7M7PUN0_NASVI|nr:uncharacterized protein LOC103317169 [Nasonia vitripennis]